MGNSAGSGIIVTRDEDLLECSSGAGCRRLLAGGDGRAGVAEGGATWWRYWACEMRAGEQGSVVGDAGECRMNGGDCCWVCGVGRANCQA